MTWNLSTFCTFGICWMFFGFLAVHYSTMKTPVQLREIASEQWVTRPWYDASFKQ